MSGPTYESTSDSRWCRLAGMDSVGNFIIFYQFFLIKFITVNILFKKGMSTSHEALVANYCGMKVLAFSIVTDLMSCEYDICRETPNHDEILKVAKLKAKDAEKLVAKFLEKLKRNPDLIN